MLEELNNALSLLTRVRRRVDNPDTFIELCLEAISELASASIEDEDESRANDLYGIHPDGCHESHFVMTLASALETAKAATLEISTRHNDRNRLLVLIRDLSDFSLNNRKFLLGKLSPRSKALDESELGRIIESLRAFSGELKRRFEKRVRDA